jgi:site-specific recombinase XerD
LRGDSNPHLWITDDGEHLSYWGLKDMMKRRADKAGVETPKIHAFRRWFALTCLRNGMDIFTLARLMGHTTIQVLSRYLKQTEYDLESSHRAANPVDKFLDGAT